MRVLTLNDEEALIAYAKPIVVGLPPRDRRLPPEHIKAKLANAEHARVHTMLVLGPRDLEAGNVSVRLHTGGPQGAKPTAQVVADILAAIRNRAV